jgi:hypothetical protein
MIPSQISVELGTSLREADLKVSTKRKKAMPGGMAFSKIIAGDHLISHTVARAVPSAQRGLTSVFEMGTGDPSQYVHRQTEAF